MNDKTERGLKTPVKLDRTDLKILRHLQADGTTLHLGEIDSHNMMIDVTYGLSDKVAIGVGAPYISTEYTGDQPHPHSQLDGGYRHGMLQDFRTSVRYSLITGRTAVTPFAGVMRPFATRRVSTRKYSTR